MRSKHWFAVAATWLISVALVLSPFGWHWG